jgi:hypothetical protein
MVIFLVSQELAEGGLFDFGATLPILMVQFVILTFVLNNILYVPLLGVIDGRRKFVALSFVKLVRTKRQVEIVTRLAIHRDDCSKASVRKDRANIRARFGAMARRELSIVQCLCDSYTKVYISRLKEHGVGPDVNFIIQRSTDTVVNIFFRY